MASNPISTPLPADLPENWVIGQTVAPNGSDASLSTQHGYNYLMQQVNAAQEGVNTLGAAFEGVPSLDSTGKVPASQLPTTSPSAQKLATARNIQTNLSSGSAASFDGTKDITPGVTGILPVAKGGTGAATPEAARGNIGAAPAYTYSTTDLEAGVSLLETGKLYFVYE